MTARPWHDPLALVVGAVAVLVLALFVVPALSSDRMPSAAVCVAIALLAAGVAVLGALRADWLRPLGGPAGRAAVAFTTLPVLAYAALLTIVAGDRVAEYHFSDRAVFTAVVACHCLWALTWLAATWSSGRVQAYASAPQLWSLVVAVPVAVTATMWLSGDFLDRVTDINGGLLIAYALAQPVAVLVVALRSRVGTVAPVLAPLTTIAIWLGVNAVLVVFALSALED